MNAIIQAITERHTHEYEVDQEQLDAVISPHAQLIIEAPAGYGKTKTMVSKIAFLIATAQVPHPKKILALTFSINAAFKIRKDVAQELPQILATSPKLAQSAVQSVLTTNYHGLSRRIIGKFGYVVDEKLAQISSLRNVGIEVYDDEKYTHQRLQNNLGAWKISLSNKETQTLIDFTRNIKTANEVAHRQNATKYLSDNFDTYLDIVKNKFLPAGYITFDAILLFTRRIFRDRPQVREFYKMYFPIIIVDEFQDTNILQWSLLQDLVGRSQDSKNQLFVFGDRFQKIYDFIGAMDGIVDLAKSIYTMGEIQLRTNHRFKGNQSLLIFDENVRKHARDPWKPEIGKTVRLNIVQSTEQDSEAEQIVSQIDTILKNDLGCTVAVLTRAGKDNLNTLRLIEELNKQRNNGFSYFYALYSDEDDEYIEFHQECLARLYENVPHCTSFNGLCKRTQENLSKKAPSETWLSLQVLLGTFVEHLNKEYKFFSLEEKIALMTETLQNKSLKQYLMYVKNAQVTLSTIHGSKGLEWDHVILPDMERNSFPSFPGLCRVCTFGSNCQIDWSRVLPGSEFARMFKQELNVFYVGGTRARKSVLFTYSSKGLNSSGQPRENNLSCFLGLEGFQ